MDYTNQSFSGNSKMQQLFGSFACGGLYGGAHNREQATTHQQIGAGRNHALMGHDDATPLPVSQVPLSSSGPSSDLSIGGSVEMDDDEGKDELDVRSVLAGVCVSVTDRSSTDSCTNS
jgi:hypothetical protein